MASKDKFTDIMIPNSTDSNFVASNGFFTAIPWKASGGGQIAVMKVDNFTKFNLNDPMIKGHSAPIIDFEFNPFIDNLLATASEDGTAALWTIPIDGLEENLTTPNATLFGHSKKLTHLTFNPTAENVFATTSFDKTVKIWDAYRGEEVINISDLIGQPTALQWNYDGSLIAVMDKDKKLHVFDPRDTKEALLASPAHEGPKQLKCCWLGESNRILTTGMSKQMYKEVCVWDPRDLTTPVKRKKADKNIEVSDPFYDPVNKLVYLAIKGESRVNIMELVDDDEVIYQIASYKGEGSHRGFNFFPKRFVDVMSSELMRAVRLTDKVCEYVSFRLPKKKGSFVPSLYGECANGEFSKTFDQWREGESAPPVTIKMSPELKGSLKLRVHDGILHVKSNEEVKSGEIEVVTVAASSAVGTSVPLASVSSTQKASEEFEELKNTYERKITELEIKLANQGSAPAEEDNQEVQNLRNENKGLNEKLSELEERLNEMKDIIKGKDKQIEDLQNVRNEMLQKLAE